MKRRSNSAAGLSSDAQRWLTGDKAGFFQFKPVSELEELFEQHGDHDRMFYRKRMACPITHELVSEYESNWIESATNGDEYASWSYWVHAHYDDVEKAALAKRGKVTWRPGQRRPELV